MRKERSGRRGLLAGSTTIVLFLLFWANMGLPPCGESWPSGARGAIRDLRTINQAEITYASTYRSYSPGLATLGPGTGSTPTATAAGLIDEVLARGTKKGYVFTYTPGLRDADGRIDSYAITAHPAEYGKTGEWEFFSDQTPVIRAVREDRPATIQDRPIDELEIE